MSTTATNGWMSDEDCLRRDYPGHGHRGTVTTLRQDPQTKEIHAIPGYKSNDEIRHQLRQTLDSDTLQLTELLADASNPDNTLDRAADDAEFLIQIFTELGWDIGLVQFAAISPRLDFGQIPFQNHDKPAFYICGTRFSLFWQYDEIRRTTRALLVHFAIVDTSVLLKDANRMMAKYIQQFRPCFGHPAYIVPVWMKIVQEDTMSSYTVDSVVLRGIEDQITPQTANQISTMQDLRDLGRLACRDGYYIKVMSRIVDYTLEINQRYGNSSSEFQWIVRQVQHSLALDILYLDSLLQSVTNQQNALSNIVNMRDSSSMKTMAVITMFFLPGTFVASFFAMPMFDWDDDSQSIVSREFWLYWAVAAPLTVTVVASWLLWWFWHNERDTWLNDQKARLLSRKNDRVLSRIEGDRYRRQEASYYMRKRAGNNGSKRVRRPSTGRSGSKV